MMFVLDALFTNLLVLIKITIVADYPCSISDRGRTGRKKVENYKCPSTGW